MNSLYEVILYKDGNNLVNPNFKEYYLSRTKEGLEKYILKKWGSFFNYKILVIINKIDLMAQGINQVHFN